VSNNISKCTHGGEGEMGVNIDPSWANFKRLVNKNAIKVIKPKIGGFVKFFPEG
jgi:hypothetical protein